METAPVGDRPGSCHRPRAVHSGLGTLGQTADARHECPSANRAADESSGSATSSDLFPRRQPGRVRLGRRNRERRYLRAAGGRRDATPTDDGRCIGQKSSVVARRSLRRLHPVPATRERNVRRPRPRWSRAQSRRSSLGGPLGPVRCRSQLVSGCEVPGRHRHSCAAGVREPVPRIRRRRGTTPTHVSAAGECSRCGARNLARWSHRRLRPGHERRGERHLSRSV